MPRSVSILSNRFDVALEVWVNTELSAHRLRNDVMSVVDNVTLALVSEPVVTHTSLPSGRSPLEAEPSHAAVRDSFGIRECDP